MEGDTAARTARVTPPAGVALGAVGVLTATITYWMVVPGIAFGIGAIWMGTRDRRAGRREAGSVAVALGIVAVLLVPSVIWVANEADEWGRNCALDPSHDPNC